MPPQGMPRPAEAEYAGFTSWLAGSLDRAWEGTQHAGPLRRPSPEPQPSMRTRFAICSALDIDVTELLPSDGADFGFDNIATSLRTSPLLLERYLTAAQRISAMAVGDPDVRARDHRVFDQPRVQPERLHRRPAARHARRHRGPSRVSGRRRVQAVGPARPRRRGRLRRRRGQRDAAHVRDHGGRRRGVFRARSAVPRTTRSRPRT